MLLPAIIVRCSGCTLEPDLIPIRRDNQRFARAYDSFLAKTATMAQEGSRDEYTGKRAPPIRTAPKSKPTIGNQSFRSVCDQCRARKIRCSREKPSCRNCGRLGLQCEWSGQGKKCNQTTLLYVLRHYFTTMYAFVVPGS